MEGKPRNWEKFAVYIAAITSVITFMVYISDIKERIAKLEVKYDLGERVKALEIVSECEIRFREEK